MPRKGFWFFKFWSRIFKRSSKFYSASRSNLYNYQWLERSAGVRRKAMLILLRAAISKKKMLEYRVPRPLKLGRMVVRMAGQRWWGYFREEGDGGMRRCYREEGGWEGWDHRVHRVATAAFWRTFSHEGKICPGWWGWGVHAHPLLLHLASPVKLQCTLQLSGQTY